LQGLVSIDKGVLSFHIMFYLGSRRECQTGAALTSFLISLQLFRSCRKCKR